MQKPEAVHTKIDEPLLARKTILESAIDATEILKSIEDLKKITERKLREKAKLKRTLGNLKKLTNDLMRELPKVAIVKEKKKEPVKKIILPRVRVVVKKRPAEVNQLDREIQDIKSKLSKLEI